MDNNQQVAGSGTEQPSAPTPVTEQAGTGTTSSSAPTTNLGVNNPGAMNVPSAFTGSDVSMTTGQYAGGKITTTEVGSK